MRRITDSLGLDDGLGTPQSATGSAPQRASGSASRRRRNRRRRSSSRAAA
jgi:hypothetical protein